LQAHAIALVHLLNWSHFIWMERGHSLFGGAHGWYADFV
jgi:hypothetical protein